VVTITIIIFYFKTILVTMVIKMVIIDNHSAHRGERDLLSFSAKPALVA